MLRVDMDVRASCISRIFHYEYFPYELFKLCLAKGFFCNYRIIYLDTDFSKIVEKDFPPSLATQGPSTPRKPHVQLDLSLFVHLEVQKFVLFQWAPSSEDNLTVAPIEYFKYTASLQARLHGLLWTCIRGRSLTNRLDLNGCLHQLKDLLSSNFRGYCFFLQFVFCFLLLFSL